MTATENDMTYSENMEKLHPIVRGCIMSLLAKAYFEQETQLDRDDALARARLLISRHALDEAHFTVTNEEEPGKSRHSRGISALIRELILTRPDWSYRQIADEVRRQIPSAGTKDATVSSHSKVMRANGIEGIIRRRK